MRPCSLLLTVVLCWSLLSPWAMAQPTAIDVVYTGNEGGVTGLSVIAEEANLFASPPDWELADFSLDMPAYRQGRYLLIDPEGHLSTERFRRFLQARPIRIEAGIPTTLIDSNYSLQLQWPLLAKPWAAEALLRLNGDPPKFPDLFEKSAMVMPVVNASGDRLWLVRNDGKPRYRLADFGLKFPEILPSPSPVATSVGSDQVAAGSDGQAALLVVSGSESPTVGSDAQSLPLANGSDRTAVAGMVPQMPSRPSPPPTVEPPVRFGDVDFSSLHRWEPVLAGRAKVRYAGRETRWLMVSKQLGTWDRRVAMIRRALDRRPGALLIGTGNTIDKQRTITTDEARRISIEAVRELPYTAFLPSAAEFALPLADFRNFSHQVPLLAANVVSPDPEVELPPYRLAKVGGVTVGVVGVVDREALRDAGVARMDAGWKVNDPLKAAQATIKELRQQGIQTIVLVTDLSYRDLQEFEHQLEGVSLLIGGGEYYPSDLGLQRQVDLDNAGLARVPRPLMIVAPRPFRFGAVRLSVDGDGRRTYPVSLRHQSWRISDDEPGDAAFAWKVAALREATQVQREYALLPDVRRLASKDGTPADATQIYYSPIQWTRLVGGLVREELQAELVVLPTLRQFWNVGGPVPAYVVDGWLAGQDRLVRLTLTGAQLTRLNELAASHDALVTAGYDPALGKVNGTALGSSERYRAIVSDRVLSNPRFAEVFSGLTKPYDSVGELKPFVLARLEQFRRDVPGYPEAMTETLQRWMTDDGSRLESRFTVNFEEMGINLLSFQNVNQSSYGQVRNTRINTPENSTVGGQGRVSLNFASEWISWTGRVKAAYQQLQLVDKVQENADDLVLTSDLRFNFWRVPLANTAVQVTPYLFSSYDTEFTPLIDSATGKANAVQRDFDGIAGLVASPGFGLQDVKLGTIVRYDATAEVLRPGLQLAAIFERELNSANHIKLRLGADLRHYFTVAAPTPDQLGFLGDISASLVVPIWQNLNLTLGTNALLYRGQAGGDPWGVSFNPTVGLSYGGVWKPRWGLSF